MESTQERYKQRALVRQARRDEDYTELEIACKQCEVPFKTVRDGVSAQDFGNLAYSNEATKNYRRLGYVGNKEPFTVSREAMSAAAGAQAEYLHNCPVIPYAKRAKV